MRIKWTQDKINFIIQQYTSKKMNTYQLAQYFGCSNDTISRKLKANGITPHKFYEDLTGQRFGKLTVIQKSAKSNRRIYWDCQCESCGCINSKNELLIQNILEDNDILFVQQYSFDDLVSEYGKKLRFDFGIIENNKLSYLIEYDGQQHFENKIQNNGWNTEENYIKTHSRDLKKNEYCLKNNIPLIRIPYTCKNNIKIEDLLLETSKFIVKGENNS